MVEYLVPTVYFEEPGPANTERTLEIGRRRAEELGLGSVVVATTSGATGVRATIAFPPSSFNLVIVSHSAGFREPDTQELLPEHREAILAAGAQLLTGTHVFGGIGRAVRRKLSTYQVDEIIAYTLRTLGQGLKVALEITMMAADAGLIRCDEEALVIGGTGSGADTAVIVRPAHAQDFFDLRVAEILCKPRLSRM